MTTSSPRQSHSLTLLSPEDLQLQLSVLEVLLSIYSSASPEEAHAHPETDDGTSELWLSPSSYAAIEGLADYLRLPVATLGDEKSVKLKESLPPLVMMRLRIEPLRGMEGDEEPNSAQTKAKRKLELDVGIPLRRQDAEASASRNRRPRMSLRCPDWMSRGAHAELCKEAGLTAPTEEVSGAADEDEDEDGTSIVMDTIERITEASLPILEALDVSADLASLSLSNGAAASSGPLGPASQNVYRSWSVLTSLSTPVKRKDLVDYAASTLHSYLEPASTLHSYLEPASTEGSAPERRSGALTGFVLAGKPAFVVIECPLPTLPSYDPKSSDVALAAAAKKALDDARSTIDGYWSEIKARSWADIPSHQKKVTERLREEGVKRGWNDVREMTESEELGGKEAMRGTYGHRNDLRRVERWLVEEKGVSKDVWNDVVGIGPNSE